MTRTKQTKRKNPEKVDGPNNKKGKESIKSEPISCNLQGVCISYDHYRVKMPYSELVSQATQVLDAYADKVYRTDEKTCYIKHRYTDPTRSLVFLETDMEDPSLLVDAIYTDLLAPCHKLSEEVKNAQHWSRLFPVQTICTKEIEDIVNNGKVVLKPVLEEDSECKVKILHYGFKDAKLHKQLFDELLICLGSKGSIVERDPEIAIVFRACGSLCLISLIRNYAKYNRYSIRDIAEGRLNQEVVEEASRPGDIPVSDGKTEEAEVEKLVEDVKNTPVVQTATTDDNNASGRQTTISDPTFKTHQSVEDDQMTTAIDQPVVDNKPVKADQTHTDNLIVTDHQTHTDNVAVTDDLTHTGTVSVTDDQIHTDNLTVADNKAVVDDKTVETNAETNNETVTNYETKATDLTVTKDEIQTNKQTVTVGELPNGNSNPLSQD